MARGSRWSGAIRPGFDEALGAGTRGRRGRTRTRSRAFQADFAGLADVRALAAELSRRVPAIDVLANNAGGAFARRVTTVDGFEQTIQVNHLAPFLLTHLLRDRLDGGRVINTASDAHSMGRLDPADLNGRHPLPAVPGLRRVEAGQHPVRGRGGAALAGDRSSYCYHPGVVRTRFGRRQRACRIFYKICAVPAYAGAGRRHAGVAGRAPVAELVNGAYYSDRKLTRAIVPGLTTRSWRPRCGRRPRRPVGTSSG